MAILPTLAIAWRMHVEERALAEQFGAAYADFRENRSAVIPCVW
jgi:protein-S-isoprenylcysteine O-methyltransferase Ste14